MDVLSLRTLRLKRFNRKGRKELRKERNVQICTVFRLKQG